MSRVRIGFACAGFVAALASGWFIAWREPEPSTAPVDTTADLARELEALRIRLRIPGMSVAIAEGDRIVWARGFGLANVERSVTAGPDTIYHLASVTKPFGTTVVLQLADESRLSLEAPLSEFGIVLERTAPVRVWHVMSHTSRDPPGTSYRYDGDAFGMLDTIVERVTGNSFASELTNRIIRRLGLRHTAPNPRQEDIALAGPWAWYLDASRINHGQRGRAALTFGDSGLDRASIESGLATGYARRWGRWIWPAGLFGPMQPTPHGITLFAGGGLVGSAPDVARFSMALDAGRLLTADTLARAYTPVVAPSGRILPCGLGWFVQRQQNMTLVWHYGQMFEASTLVVKIPERRLTFVALANSDGLSRWRRLGDTGNVLASPAAMLFLNWIQNRV